MSTHEHGSVQLPPPAEIPTIYFIGVTTGKSSIQQVFPKWAAELGLGDVRLQGIDLPPHAPEDSYRQVVDFIANDPLSWGGLVTTHKIDLYNACSDMFDEIDRFARMMGETSCLSKRDGKLICHAKDPISSGLALEAFLPAGYWQETGAEAFLMGAGGSTIAISWYLTQPEFGTNRPSRIVVTNRSPQRLESLERIYADLDVDVPLETIHAPTPADNDAALRDIKPRSLVVNATGLGKDAPGSPLTDAVEFPQGAIAWDLNYRGELVFLDQARAADHVQVEDGWIYFIHGWTQVIAEVFDIDLPTSGPKFDALSDIAAGTRG